MDNYKLKDERRTLGIVASWLRGETEIVRQGVKQTDFDMDRYALCIGARAYMVENPGCPTEDAMRHVQTTYYGLGDLYYATRAFGRLDAITREEAARAIDNYLATGKPEWERIFKERRP